MYCSSAHRPLLSHSALLFTPLNYLLAFLSTAGGLAPGICHCVCVWACLCMQKWIPFHTLTEVFYHSEMLSVPYAHAGADRSPACWNHFSQPQWWHNMGDGVVAFGDVFFFCDITSDFAFQFLRIKISVLCTFTSYMTEVSEGCNLTFSFCKNMVLRTHLHSTCKWTGEALYYGERYKTVTIII